MIFVKFSITAVKPLVTIRLIDIYRILNRLLHWNEAMHMYIICIQKNTVGPSDLVVIDGFDEESVGWECGDFYGDNDGILVDDVDDIGDGLEVGNFDDNDDHDDFW